MAKPNFSFQKRQKELVRQKKQEEKKQRKMEKTAPRPDDNLGSGTEADTRESSAPTSAGNDGA